MKKRVNKFICEIKNLPRYIPDKYVVARIVNSELWYWGSYDDKVKADRAARELENGVVVTKVEETEDED